MRRNNIVPQKNQLEFKNTSKVVNQKTIIKIIKNAELSQRKPQALLIQELKV
jgi:hypothetical protein